MRILRPIYLIICFIALNASANSSHISFNNLERNERGQFLALTNWKRYIRTMRINGDRVRKIVYKSVRKSNPYKNPAAQFQALNESFYKNKNLKCERFASYQFMATVIGEDPYAYIECNNYFTTFINTHTGFKEVSFFKNRIIFVSYLMASNGEAAMSRFGHSMFYVRACKSDIEECPLKEQVEFILGVAADVDDLSPGVLKGIFGGYKAKVDIMGLAQVKQKYNYDEFRDLEQYNLKLSQLERRRFISHIIHLYQSKDMGDYKFFSANCATESHKILRATIDKDKLTGSVMTPKGLLSDLLDDGLISRRPNRKFKEKSKIINKHLSYFGFKKIEDYYEISSNDRFNLAKDLAGDNLKLIKSSYVFLEKMALLNLQSNIMNNSIQSDDKDIAKRFKKLAKRYKEWQTQNSLRIRSGLNPIENSVASEMSVFYESNYSHIIKEINQIAINLQRAKSNFK